MRPNHLLRLAEIMARTDREPVSACVSSPPRHGKTNLLLHAGVRHLMLYPTHTVGYVSHNDDLAHSKSREAREIAIRAGLQLAKDSTSVHNWRTVQGGGFLAAGRTAGWSGYGVNLFLLDDLIADRSQAESAAEQQQIEDFFRSTAIQRVMPGGSTIVNMTRWSNHDLIAKLVAEGWEWCNIPVQNERGEWLWPEFWPPVEMEAKKRATHEFEWWALYMGAPRPRGGSLFHEPTRYEKAHIYDSIIVIACDPAATAKTSADHSAIVVAAGQMVDGMLHMDVLEVRRRQVEIPALVDELARMAGEDGYRCQVAIEAVGGFKAVPQMLRRMNPRLRIVEITPATDKIIRATPAAAAWNDGRVRVPFDKPWVGPFVDEVCNFTGIGDSHHDDQVDALAHCYNTLLDELRKRPRADVAQRLYRSLPFAS